MQNIAFLYTCPTESEVVSTPSTAQTCEFGMVAIAGFKAVEPQEEPAPTGLRFCARSTA